MNPQRPSASWHSTCVGCAKPFTQYSWDCRHDVNDDDARSHNIDPGEYHELCCPAPQCAAAHEMAS